MAKRWKKEVVRMIAYVTFPVAMFGIFNSPWFYEDAMYQARMAYQMRRDIAGGQMLREAIAQAKQRSLERSISERDE